MVVTCDAVSPMGLVQRNVDGCSPRDRESSRDVVITKFIRVAEHTIRRHDFSTIESVQYIIDKLGL